MLEKRNDNPSESFYSGSEYHESIAVKWNENMALPSNQQVKQIMV